MKNQLNKNNCFYDTAKELMKDLYKSMDKKLTLITLANKIVVFCSPSRDSGWEGYPELLRKTARSQKLLVEACELALGINEYNLGKKVHSKLTEALKMAGEL